MVPRGTSFDSGAGACPFVALELDRDRRSERPDYRHRCYAEPLPAPRTIAHQERFCLSPNFPTCPIFQDWAVRAAARPVPLPEGQEGRRSTPDPRAPGAPGLAAAGGAVAADQVADVPGADEPALERDEPWPDSMAPAVPTAMAEEGPPDDAENYFSSEEQLSAFDSSVPPEAAAPLGASSYAQSPYARPPGSGEREPVARSSQPEPVPQSSGDVAGSATPEAAATDEAAPVPGFLADRAARPRPSPKVDERVTREDVVPSWELDGRFGAQAGGGSGSSRDGWLGRLLTIVAVIAILGLGVAAVVLVPGLLSGSPTTTTRPSAPASAPASPRSSPGATTGAVVQTSTPLPLTTPPPASVAPTRPPSPNASPVLYRIRAGDTLAKIARRNDITVPELLAANPQITNPNHIEVGQVIVIPLPTTTPAP